MADMTDVDKVARAIAPMARWEKADPTDGQLEDMEYARDCARRAIACLRSMGWAPLEEAARVAEDAYKRGHRTGDMETAVEPDNIAAAIRALAPKPETQKAPPAGEADTARAVFEDPDASGGETRRDASD